MGVVFASNAQVREIFFGVQVSVNGEVQNFDEDMTPFIMDGRTFLPVRGIADTLGVDVDFDEATNTVLLRNPHFMEELLVTFEPMIQPMLEAMGLDIEWDEIMAEMATVDWNEMMEFMMLMFAEIDWAAIMGGTWDDLDFLSGLNVEFVPGIPAGHALLGSTWSWDGGPLFVYTFNADGTGTRGIPGMMESFNWAIPEAGHILMDVGTMVESWSYTITGNVFTITSRQVPGMTFSYIRQ